MARHLHIGISRLNKAIAEYSLARLEFTLRCPDGAQPPVLARVGGRASADESPASGWAGVMKRVATLTRYVDAARSANAALARDPAFARLAETANDVALLAWNMESLHRRGGRIG